MIYGFGDSKSTRARHFFWWNHLTYRSVRFNFSAYKDEPEDGEEVSEEKDVADEDVFSYQSNKSSESDIHSGSKSSSLSLPASKPQAGRSQASKPVAKIDLGAAATLVNVAKAAESKTLENGSNQQAPNASTGSSAMGDLFDLMNTGPSSAPLAPVNNTSEPDLFGGFMSAPDNSKCLACSVLT